MLCGPLTRAADWCGSGAMPVCFDSFVNCRHGRGGRPRGGYCRRNCRRDSWLHALAGGSAGGSLRLGLGGERGAKKAAKWQGRDVDL